MKRVVFLLVFAMATLMVAACPLMPPEDGVCESSAPNINKGQCTLTVRGKTYKLYGKVQIVNQFPDIKVKLVDNYADLNVQLVDNFANKCGQVQLVESFPDVKVQIVDNFADLTVKVVKNFPGLK